VYQRLVVTSANREWKVIAGRSLRDVRFVRPVRANDVLTGTMVIDEIRLDDRARGLVTTSAELVNAQGNCVLTVTTDAYLHSRAG
jgi:acyl dehydratase